MLLPRENACASPANAPLPLRVNCRLGRKHKAFRRRASDLSALPARSLPGIHERDHPLVALHQGRGARAQASYRPSWARAVDSAMGAAGRTLVEHLREHDGQAPFLLVAEGLEDMLRKMELKGFTR